MKQKETIAEGLQHLDIKIPNRFYWAGYSFLAHLPFVFGPKYHVTYKTIDDIREEKGPCFVIWNHQSRRDYIFMKNLLKQRRFNMVAGYCEFFKSHLRPLFDKVQVIPKKNFCQDTNSLRLMQKIIDQGGTITFSPEGLSSVYGCQQPIVPGTGRFLKYWRIPVYFMKLEGAYLTSHKTSTEDRPGKVFATLSKLFSKEDIINLTPEEIEDKINESFYQDDYKWNKEKRIKYKTRKNAAKNMHSLAYKCPKCGTEMEMTSNGEILKCNYCGNGCRVNEYYDFIPFDDTCVIPQDLVDWVELERRDIILNIRKDPNYCVSFNCKVGSLPKYKLLKHYKSSELCGEGKFTIDHSGLHFEGTKDGQPWKFDLSYSVYYTLIMEDKTDMFNIFVNGEYYDFIPEDVQYVGKAFLTVEEMHRLHVNTFKHLKCKNYLYKDTELDIEKEPK